MITLYSYPQLFGLPDNNPFGLKVDTFLRLTNIPFVSEHILNTQQAPRGQLPYIHDAEHVVTESNAIINYLTKSYGIALDHRLNAAQKNQQFLVTRMLDSHLYWVMSYSRWQDEQFWPLFKAEFLRQSPQFAEAALEKARQYNIEKYHYQGIGRYSGDEVYQAGIDDLKAISLLLGQQDFFFGKTVHSLDACCYGFLANIFFFDIDTPLREFLLKATALSEYVQRIRDLLNY